MFVFVCVFVGVVCVCVYGYDLCVLFGECGIEIVGVVMIGLVFWFGGAFERWDGYYLCV